MGSGLYRRMLAARIRSDWQYRASFVTFLFAQAMVTALEFTAVVILLDVGQGLGGWSASQVAFLYGLSAVPFGLADLFVSAVERVSIYVQQGTFDRILLRPVSPLLQISAQEFELRRAGKVIPPLAVLIWAVPRVEIDWTPATVAVLTVAVISATVIYSALWILSASITFWMVASQQATNAMTYGGQFANQYPFHLYRGWIRLILGWILPLAFVAYIPAVYLLDAPNPLGLPGWLVLASAPVAALALAVALTVWGIGVRHYQGTGS